MPASASSRFGKPVISIFIFFPSAFSQETEFCPAAPITLSIFLKYSDFADFDCFVDFDSDCLDSADSVDFDYFADFDCLDYFGYATIF